MAVPYHFSGDEKLANFVEVTPPTSMSPIEDEKKPLILEEKVKLKAEGTDVQGMMDETVKRVREQSDRLQKAAAPFATKTRSFAEDRPVLFTYLAIFGTLSVMPLACFAGFLLSATLFILGVAAVGICLSLLTCILLGASILIPVLLFTTFLSIMTLSFLLSLFLANRLYLHLSIATAKEASYSTLSKGIKDWLAETTGRVSDSFPNVLGWNGVNWVSTMGTGGMNEKVLVRGEKVDLSDGRKGLEVRVVPRSELATF